MKTGNTTISAQVEQWCLRASMEPGHEDREYRGRLRRGRPVLAPQWSPVMKTGNTG